jgi:hypothetical protein
LRSLSRREEKSLALIGMRRSGLMKSTMEGEATSEGMSAVMNRAMSEGMSGGMIVGMKVNRILGDDRVHVQGVLAFGTDKREGSSV